jgi:hypothetical protein
VILTEEKEAALVNSESKELLVGKLRKEATRKK